VQPPKPPVQVETQPAKAPEAAAGNKPPVTADN
jgi:hypothetical protein